MMWVQVNDNMGRAPSIDDALPSSSGRTPAMSRAHSVHSSASGLNAAGPSHHEHLVGPHHCMPALHNTTCTPPLHPTPGPCLCTPTPHLIFAIHPCTLSVHPAYPNLCIAAGVRVPALAEHAATDA